MYQRPIQSVNSFKSYRANKLKSTDRQTDRQTCRFLHNRLLEHARSVKNEENKTALAEHAITYKHSFDFKNAKILDIEKQLKEKIIARNNLHSKRKFLN